MIDTTGAGSEQHQLGQRLVVEHAGSWFLIEEHALELEVSVVSERGVDRFWIPTVARAMDDRPWIETMNRLIETGEHELPNSVTGHGASNDRCWELLERGGRQGLGDNELRALAYRCWVDNGSLGEAGAACGTFDESWFARTLEWHIGDLRAIG